MKLKLAAAAALLALSTSASLAANYNIGPLPITPPSAPFSQAVTVPVGSFLDRWDFSFTGVSASASSISLTLNSVLNISGLQLRLYGADNTLRATGAQSGQGVTLNDVALTSGSYYYLVSGTGTGSAGGAYTFIASASPVPEPGTYALFLAGLAAVGFVARRRVPA